MPHRPTLDESLDFGLPEDYERLDIPGPRPDGDRLAFTQACAYPDGTRVFCSAMIELEQGKIARQTNVQAWDS
jgi:hypothetical protein